MFDPWVRKIPWRRRWQPIPIFLPGKSHGQRSLLGYSPRGHRVRHDLATKPQLNTNEIYFLIQKKVQWSMVAMWMSKLGIRISAGP